MSQAALAITIGEPAGIGPEISLRAAWQIRQQQPCLLIGDAAWLACVAQQLDPAIQLRAISASALAGMTALPSLPDTLWVLDVPLREPVIPGQLDSRNGRAVLATLDAALDLLKAGKVAGMVTAPLQKSVINQAGVKFSGHTEYLAEQTQTEQVVMMLAAPAGGILERPLRVALATTHLPLQAVSAALEAGHLLRTLQIIHFDLKQRFGLAQPKILMAGLNPHAGENGYLGREEIEILQPVIASAQQAGIDVSGPYPADTLFQTKYLNQADCVLAMYHDQGLPVLKFASFGKGVNITLGLPYIRTSVDHGTALDLAAQGIGLADHGSMMVAIQVAAEMVKHRQA